MGARLHDLDRELRAFVDAERERLRVPGAAVGVIHGGEEWYAGFGLTNIEHPLPVDEATLFQIGSNTKTFVATAVMRAVEAGRIDLDGPLRAYLPDFELGRPGFAERVTVRHLLTHTGGWDGDWLLVHPQGGRNDNALERVVESMPRVPVQTAPGALYHYNNTGFSLAGRVLEVVWGQPFEAVLRELLFAPLGLERAVFLAQEAITRRTAVGHVVRAGSPEVARMWELPRCSFPAGGIACDIRDLLRWGRFQLARGVTESGERVLDAASIAAMHSPQVEVGDTAEAVGLSWMLGSTGGARTVSHSGGTDGQVSLHTVYPELDAAIGVVTNANTGSELTRNVTRFIQSRLLGLEHSEPEPVDGGDVLDEYVGTYEREMTRVEVTREGGRLRAQATALTRPEDWTATPQGPTVAVGLLAAPDSYVVLEGDAAGSRGRFFRDAAGAIEWLRWGGRLHRRQ